MGNVFRPNTKCVFCEIVHNYENKLESKKVLAANENLLIFADIKPASTHHYLVIPCEHITSAKTLHGEEHIKLVEEMYKFGRDYLHSVTEEDLEDSLYGFHFPPFISVHHLHLHVIFSAKKLSYVGSSLFRKGSWYFVSPEAIIEQLKLQINLQ